LPALRLVGASGQTFDQTPPAGPAASVRSPGGAARGDVLLDAILVSTGVVALGEMGDKSRIATVVLAARYG
jgi:putative Ca2+/H+ antiporter (TMEM165/GDT1 family)